MPTREVQIISGGPELYHDAERIKDALRRSFGHYATRIVAEEDEVVVTAGGRREIVPLRVGEIVVSAEEDRTDERLASFVTDKLRLAPEDLSCREDAVMLERYVRPDGTLDITADPREWILGNSVIAELVVADQRYGNLLDYLVEQRGLFIKPAQYAIQRNHWNATTNAGLPIVRKRDEVHEGTFMLHDLYHFALEDPLPASLDPNMSPGQARRAFVMHRMASEASTLVMADMFAVSQLGLEDRGYDVDKRKIYPVYRDILGSGNQFGAEDILHANLLFCFSGNTDGFKALGASDQALADFRGKYEVFFSADFDWNGLNFDACEKERQAHPDFNQYYEEVRERFGIHTIDSMYPHAGQLRVSDVADSFTRQLQVAFNYQGSDNPMARIGSAGRKYLAGQTALFYRFPDTALRAEFDEGVTVFMEASDEAEARDGLDACQTVAQANLTSLLNRGKITTQDFELWNMHVPLYPAQFINYEKEQGQYRNLEHKMTELEMER